MNKGFSVTRVGLRQLLVLGALTLLLTTLTQSIWAQTEPSREPILRIETGMHTAPINRIGVDGAGKFLVTASLDKTARVWELTTGRLLRVLRVPIGGGNEGILHAAAISPDGKTIAAGGWTGNEWDKQISVYLFDRESGRLMRRVDRIAGRCRSPRVLAGRRAARRDARWQERRARVAHLGLG